MQAHESRNERIFRESEQQMVQGIDLKAQNNCTLTEGADYSHKIVACFQRADMVSNNRPHRKERLRNLRQQATPHEQRTHCMFGTILVFYVLLSMLCLLMLNNTALEYTTISPKTDLKIHKPNLTFKPNLLSDTVQLLAENKKQPNDSLILPDLEIKNYCHKVDGCPGTMMFVNVSYVTENPPKGTQVAIIISLKHLSDYWVGGISPTSTTFLKVNDPISFSVCASDPGMHYMVGCLLPPALNGRFKRGDRISPPFDMCEAIGSYCGPICQEFVSSNETGCDPTTNEVNLTSLLPTNNNQSVVVSTSDYFLCTLAVMMAFGIIQQLIMFAPFLRPAPDRRGNKHATDNLVASKSWLENTGQITFSSIMSSDNHVVTVRSIACTLISARLHQEVYGMPFENIIAIDSNNPDEKAQVIRNIFTVITTCEDSNLLRRLSHKLRKSTSSLVGEILEREIRNKIESEEERQLFEKLISMGALDHIEWEEYSKLNIETAESKSTRSIHKNQIRFTRLSSPVLPKFNVMVMTPNENYKKEKGVLKRFLDSVWYCFTYIPKYCYYKYKKFEEVPEARGMPGKGTWNIVAQLYGIHVLLKEGIDLLNMYFSTVDIRHALSERFFSLGKAYFFTADGVRKQRLRAHIFLQQYDVQSDEVGLDCGSYFHMTNFIRNQVQCVSSSGTNTTVHLGPYKDGTPFFFKGQTLTEDAETSYYWISKGDFSTFSAHIDVVNSIPKDMIRFMIAGVRWVMGSVEILCKMSGRNISEVSALVFVSILVVGCCALGYWLVVATYTQIVFAVAGLFAFIVAWIILCQSLRFQAMLVLWTIATYPVIGPFSSVYWTLYVVYHMVWGPVSTLNVPIVFLILMLNFGMQLIAFAQIRRWQSQAGDSSGRGLTQRDLDISMRNWMTGGLPGICVIFYGIYSCYVNKKWDNKSFKVIFALSFAAQMMFYIASILYVVVTSIIGKLTEPVWVLSDYRLFGALLAAMYALFVQKLVFAYFRKWKILKTLPTIPGNFAITLVMAFVTICVIAAYYHGWNWDINMRALHT